MSDVCRLEAILTSRVKDIYAMPGAIMQLFDVDEDPDLRSIGAQVLVSSLSKLVELDESKRCRHPPHHDALDTKPWRCIAHRIWPTQGEPCIRSAEDIVKAFDEKRSDFDDLLPPRAASSSDSSSMAQALLPHATVADFVGILLRLLPLVFDEPMTSPSSGLDPSAQLQLEFAQPFHGTRVDALIHFTCTADAYVNASPDAIYAKTFPILQSSGTGKSRLAVQLSAKQVGLLVCTRSPSHASTSTPAFPPTDAEVYDYFVDTLHRRDSFHRYKRVAAWLGAYFDHFADVLKTCIDASGCFRCDNSEGRTIKVGSAHSNADCEKNGWSIDACWESVARHLACLIYGGLDFGQDCYSFSAALAGNESHQVSDEENRRPQLCPASNLFQQQTHTSSSSSSLKGKTSTSSAPKLSSSVPDADVDRFRTHLLHRITEQAKSHFASPGLQGNDDATETEVQPEAEARTAAKMFITEKLEKLEALLPAELRDKCFFFLALDEVLGLNALLPIFQRLWRECGPKSTWLLLIDADPNIVQLGNDEVVPSAARMGESEGRMILPPFLYMPLDVGLRHHIESLTAPIQAGRLTFAKLLDTLRYFGRPLWSTGLYTDSADPDAVRPHLVNVLRKLLVRRSTTTSLWPSVKDTDITEIIMSAVGQRLPLLFVGHPGTRRTGSEYDTHMLQKTTEFLQEQVSRHLRIASNVGHTGRLVTATPSEPALSLAVASLFRGDDADATEQCKARWSDAVQVLASAHRSVGLALGEQREEGREGDDGVRLLCSMALDLVAARRVERACAHEPLSKTSLQLFEAQCQPICLKDWLVELLGLEDRQHGALLDWSADYYLNFTHCLRIGAPLLADEMDAMLLVEYWWRQVAFYGVLYQPGWSLVIPIYRSPSHAPVLTDLFRPDQMSYVAIQVKDRFSTGSATQCFGPCHKVDRDASSASTDTNTDTASADQPAIPEIALLEECLEIVFDLRAPSSASVLNQYARDDPVASAEEGPAASNEASGPADVSI